MRSFTPKAFFVYLVLALLLFQPFVAHHAAAKTIVVVDVDGNTNNYVALATILVHRDVADNLRLVTVNGATFGYASTVVQNICSFLSLAGRPSVPVAMGQVSALVDAYNSETHIGDCKRKQGFPATPHDASLRGMLYSKSDVTSAFGQTYQLPRTATEAENCMLTIDSATNSFLTLVRQSTTGDKIVYLQLGSSTNFGRILDALVNSNISSSLFYSLVQVHAFESGYNGGADGEAMGKLLGDKNLTLYLYPPSFYSPSPAFNDTTWKRFITIPQSPSSTELVKWLYEVLDAKKKLVENRGNSMDFYNEFDLASSLVTLCALDESIENLCKKYRNTASAISFNYTLPSNDARNLVLSISGNNVTAPFYYRIEPLSSVNGSSNPVNNRNLSFYNVSASVKVDNAASSLADTFLEIWLVLLQS
ncbi:unnamed protein product [Phytomonas sp. EM1]|nr:unnamed protein product [Phytomonas sp. EM1]|eukprot:CCW60621.1 unnamed protein product [Phytomonas sp. isolate EM1]